MSTIIVDSTGGHHAQIETDVEHDQLHQPAVFIRIPRLAAAREPRPVTRAAMNVPPNLPAVVATRTIRAQIAQLDAPDTRSIRVRMPANAKMPAAGES